MAAITGAARYNQPPWRVMDLRPTEHAVPSDGDRSSSTAWYRRPPILLGVVIAILIILIIWGIIALFTGNQGGIPSITTTTLTPSTTATTSPTTTTTTSPTTTSSGEFHLPSLPSNITLPSLPGITLPSLP